MRTEHSSQLAPPSTLSLAHMYFVYGYPTQRLPPLGVAISSAVRSVGSQAY